MRVTSLIISQYVSCSVSPLIIAGVLIVGGRGPVSTDKLAYTRRAGYAVGLLTLGRMVRVRVGLK